MNTKHGWSIFGRLALVLPFALGICSGAWADENDPPSRVARLAFEEGAVSLQPGGVEDWVAAPVNRPLTTGDKLWSDRDSRAELQLDGSVLRLSSQTAVSFLNLNDTTTQIRLTSGTLVVHVRRLDDDETYEIDTPNLAFSILRPGLYRISVDESGTATTIGVRSGQGEVTGGGAAYPVRANEQDVFTGTNDLAEEVQPYGQGEGPFDAWSASRDDRWEHSVSARYVSPDAVGYEDLDDHGTWNSTPEYGNVWFPRDVPPGWAPYHDGHWAYIAPWGYTWVDDQPWGFAPFHYGRWVAVSGAWGWVPAPPRPEGEVYVRPVYAPALVAWVGVGVGVAWFALGPREVYVPSYPVSRGYMNNVNVSNTVVNRTVVNNIYNTTIINNNRTVNVNNRTVNVTNVTYVNRNVPGAVAATTSQAFSNAQPVSRNAVRFDPHAGGRVQVFAPAAVPTKQAVLGWGRAGVARPPLELQTRAVVARTAPPPPALSFERRQQAIEQNGGRPLSVAEVREVQPRIVPRNAPVLMAPPATLGITHPHAEHETPRAEAPPGARPVDRPAAASTPPAQPPSSAVHPKEVPVNFRPPSPSVANSALERQHLQEQQQLRAQQDEERQRVQQQQEREHQLVGRQQAEKTHKEQLSQQLEQQHQQQTQALVQRHAQEQEQLQRQQQQQRQQQEAQTKPGVRKENRPPNAEH
jgi:FecR protein